MQGLEIELSGNETFSNHDIEIFLFANFRIFPGKESKVFVSNVLLSPISPSHQGDFAMLGNRAEKYT